ncbi:MAG: GumC family protein, partial [Cytophagales bacterium]
MFKDLDVFATSNKITAEIEVIKSNVLINKVLDNLDFDLEVYRIGQVRKVELYHQSPFIIQGKFTSPKAYDQRFLLQVHSLKNFTLTSSASGEIKKGTFGQRLELGHGQLTISLNHRVISAKADFSLVDNYEFEFLSREKLIRKIASHLDVIAVDKDVAVVRINFKSPVAEKASRLVNQMAESYITDYIDTKYRAAQVTVRFLNDRIDEIAKKLDQSEETIQRYRSDRDIINIHQETETDLRKIAQLKIQFANVKINLSAISELDSYIQAGKSDFLALAPNFEAFTDLLSTEIIKKMKQLQADKKDLLITFTPEDDRVKVIDSKIKDLSNYLIESIGNTHKNLQTKHNRLEKEIEEAEKVFIGIPEKEKVLTILNREFEIYQRSYNFLNEKKIEAEIAQAAKIAFHRVISPAEPSSVPVSPNRPIIIIVSSILAMIGSILFILFIHLAKAK